MSDYWVCPECGTACSFMGDVCTHWLKACAQQLAELREAATLRERIELCAKQGCRRCQRIVQTVTRR